MTGLILPYRRQSHPLRDKLGSRDRGAFYSGVQMTDAVSKAVQKASRERGLDVAQTLDALLTVVASFVQSQAPVGEWQSVGEVLAEELRARLQVTGDTGTDDHARRMV